MTLWEDRLKSAEGHVCHVAAGSSSLPFPDHGGIYFFSPLAVETPAVYFDHIGAPFHFRERGEGTVRSLISKKIHAARFCLTSNTYQAEINGPLTPPNNYTLLLGSITPLVLISLFDWHSIKKLARLGAWTAWTALTHKSH